MATLFCHPSRCIKTTQYSIQPNSAWIAVARNPNSDENCVGRALTNLSTAALTISIFSYGTSTPNFRVKKITASGDRPQLMILDFASVPLDIVARSFVETKMKLVWYKVTSSTTNACVPEEFASFSVLPIPTLSLKQQRRDQLARIRIQ